MESYKHSCPFCGQHIEYTVGYCGKQIQCPMCGKTVTFPAMPPKPAGPALRIKNTAAKVTPGWTRKLPAALGFLRNFQHWNVVAQCAVPFLIIAVLLGGAIFVKNKFGEPASDNATPAVQADPAAWQRMADLSKADQAVQAAKRDLAAAHANADLAERRLRQLQNMEPFQKKTAEEQVQLAQKNLVAARLRFDKAYDLYRQLGGTVDYRSLVTY